MADLFDASRLTAYRTPMNSENGMLASVPGAVIAAAGQTLPTAGADQADEHVVIVDAWHAGVVRIKYKLHRHSHRRNVRWWWSAYHAETVGPDELEGVTPLQVPKDGNPNAHKMFGHLMPWR